MRTVDLQNSPLCLPIMDHNGLYARVSIGHILKATDHGQHRGQSVMYTNRAVPVELF